METNQNFFFIIWDHTTNAFIKYEILPNGKEIVCGVMPENASRFDSFEQAKQFILTNLLTAGNDNCAGPGDHERILFWIPEIIIHNDFKKAHVKYVSNAMQYIRNKKQLQLKSELRQQIIARRQANLKKANRFTYGDFVELIHWLIVLFGFLAILLICVKIIYN